jgi:hypothetical protein
METFRLWFEEDREIPLFKRLAFEKVTVSIADVLRKGIHPWQGANVHRSLKEKFVEVLNSGEMKPAELAQFGYCADVSCVVSSYPWQKESRFEETLERIREGAFFVESLSYVELMEIAKERLQRNWSHRTAHSLLSRTHVGFDEMRRFLKAKDENIKLSGYADVERYDLGETLSLEDFAGEDNILISEGIPVTNFRSSRFLRRVTGERGLLRLTDGIRDFQVMAGCCGSFCHASLRYNCQRDRDTIRFVPELNKDQDKRELARSVAQRWRIDQGQYCFTTDIARLSEMLEQEQFKIAFPTLDYMKPREPAISSAEMAQSKVKRFSVGKFLTGQANGESIKAILRDHGVSMTGRKEELLEKLAALSAKIYEEKEAQLDTYFRRYRFIRVANGSKDRGETFPVLEECCLRNMVLTMYIMKHLRGNTILVTSHHNDTFDLLSLASSLIKREVTLSGVFLRVE